MSFAQKSQEACSVLRGRPLIGPIDDFVLCGESENSLFALSQNWVLKSSDEGRNWHAIAQIETDPDSDENERAFIDCYLNGVIVVQGSKTLLSLDRGASFSELNLPFYGQIQAIALSGSISGVEILKPILVVSRFDSILRFSLSSRGIFLLDVQQFVHPVRSIDGNSGLIWAISEKTVLLSTDLGESFRIREFISGSFHEFKEIAVDGSGEAWILSDDGLFIMSNLDKPPRQVVTHGFLSNYDRIGVNHGDRVYLVANGDLFIIHVGCETLIEVDEQFFSASFQMKPHYRSRMRGMLPMFSFVASFGSRGKECWMTLKWNLSMGQSATDLGWDRLFRKLWFDTMEQNHRFVALRGQWLGGRRMLTQYSHQASPEIWEKALHSIRAHQEALVLMSQIGISARIFHRIISSEPDR